MTNMGGSGLERAAGRVRFDRHENQSFDSGTYLSAKQAASRLGIKIETLYAYVSRGIIDRVKAGDSGRSKFLACQIEDLALKKTNSAGSGGIGVVLFSSITTVSNGVLFYRGKQALDLARDHSFEEVAEFLWGGGLSVAQSWRAQELEIEAAKRALLGLPRKMSMIDRIRGIIWIMSIIDGAEEDWNPSALMTKSRRLLSGIAHCLATAEDPAQAVDGFDADAGALSERLWQSFGSSYPYVACRRILEQTLILSADHDIVPSTLAVRVAASSRTMLYNAIGAGLASFSGSLHGRTVSAISQLLRHAELTGAGFNFSDEWTKRAEIRTAFGHRLYRDGDPRARAILDGLTASTFAAEKKKIVQRVLLQAKRAGAPAPSLGFALGAFAYLGEFRAGSGESLFAVARIAGWIAHALEEYSEVPFRYSSSSHFVERPSN